MTLDPRMAQAGGQQQMESAHTGAEQKPKPSFDCRKARSASARLICADDDLTAVNSVLGGTFQDIKSKASVEEQKDLLSKELTWIRDRNQKCGLTGKDAASVDELKTAKMCMLDAITARIDELESQPQRGVSGVEGSESLAVQGNSAEDQPSYFVANTKPPDAFLSLRSEPSTTAGRRIAQMPNGTELRVLMQRPDGWWHVRVAATGQEGWVLSGEGPIKWIECCREPQRNPLVGSAAKSAGTTKQPEDSQSDSQTALKCEVVYQTKLLQGDVSVSKDTFISNCIRTSQEGGTNDEILLNITLNPESCRYPTGATIMASVRGDAAHIFLHDAEMVPVLSYLWRKLYAVCVDVVRREGPVPGATLGPNGVTSLSVSLGLLNHPEAASEFVMSSPDGVHFQGPNGIGDLLRGQMRAEEAGREMARQQQLQTDRIASAIASAPAARGVDAAIPNQDVVERLMKGAMPAQAQCNREASASHCGWGVPGSGHYYYQINYTPDMVNVSIARGNEFPDSFSRDLVSMTKFMGEFGFGPNEIGPCVQRSNAPAMVALAMGQRRDQEIVHQKLIMLCSSSDELGMVVLTLSTNTRF